MPILFDTIVLIRLANTSDPQAPVAARTVAELRRRGEHPSITAQVLAEFRAVATRPTVANGLGFTTRATDTLPADEQAAVLADRDRDSTASGPLDPA